MPLSSSPSLQGHHILLLREIIWFWKWLIPADGGNLFPKRTRPPQKEYEELEIKGIFFFQQLMLYLSDIVVFHVLRIVVIQLSLLFSHRRAIFANPPPPPPKKKEWERNEECSCWNTCMEYFSDLQSFRAVRIFVNWSFKIQRQKLLV